MKTIMAAARAAPLKKAVLDNDEPSSEPQSLVIWIKPLGLFGPEGADTFHTSLMNADAPLSKLEMEAEFAKDKPETLGPVQTKPVDEDEEDEKVCSFDPIWFTSQVDEETRRAEEIAALDAQVDKLADLLAKLQRETEECSRASRQVFWAFCHWVKYWFLSLNILLSFCYYVFRPKQPLLKWKHRYLIWKLSIR